MNNTSPNNERDDDHRKTIDFDPNNDMSLDDAVPMSPVVEASETANLKPSEMETASLNSNSSDGTNSFVVDPEATQVHQKSLHLKSQHRRVEIPGYKILSELGRGGMGVVYKAHQTRADRMVALKVMLNSDHAHDAEIARFAVEAQAAARLQHSNIVQVHEVGQAGDVPYFSLEFVEGGTLAQRIAKQMFSPEESGRKMLILAQAIAYAHSKEVIHRDLKPANILLDLQGNPKIADFGLARRTDDVSHLTIDGTILGTPTYMAPEQAMGVQQNIGKPADVYTLGAILYELLAGRPPFKAASAWEVIQQVRYTEPIPPSAVQPNIPKDIETICLKCLQKEPGKRYASAQMLADDLQRYLNHEPILARPISQWERFVRFCRRHPRETSLVGAVVALLAVLGVGATGTAYRIYQDRQHIGQQRDQIAKQRDTIAEEKKVSDQRLITYRDTVSQLVNRAPHLLEYAPLGAGTRTEFNSLIFDVLNSSEDGGAVGPSRQWGLQAISIRKGENKIAEATADAKQSDRAEIVSNLLKGAFDDFTEAERIAKEAYEQYPNERSKAAENMAVAISSQARCARLQKVDWKEVFPIYRRAIEFRREALNAEEKVRGPLVALRQQELGMELTMYAEFLLDLTDVDKQQFALKANEYLTDGGPLLLQASQSMPASSEERQNALRDYAITLQNRAVALQRLGEAPKAEADLAEAFKVLGELCSANPNRYAFRVNLIEAANKYGDYLLGSGADAKKIEQPYLVAMDTLKQTLDAAEIRTLFDGWNGLAMEYYRIGLLALRKNDPATAKDQFSRCALLRELAWSRTLEKQSDPNDLDTSLTQRIELMLAQSRSGKVDAAFEHAKWIIARAGRLASTQPTEKAGGFDAAQLYIQAAAGLGLCSEHLNASKQDTMQQQAMKAVEKGIENGYRDFSYLATDPDFAPLQKFDSFNALIQPSSKVDDPKR